MERFLQRHASRILGEIVSGTFYFPDTIPPQRRAKPRRLSASPLATSWRKNDGLIPILFT